MHNERPDLDFRDPDFRDFFADFEVRFVCVHDLGSTFLGLSNKRHWLCTMKDLTPIFLQ